MTNVRKFFLRVTSCFGFYCGTYRSILLGPKSLLKRQIFEEQGKLSTEKNYLTVFSRDIEYEKLHKTFYKGPKGFLAIPVEAMRSILQDLRGWWKILRKKGELSIEKKIVAFFSPIIEHENVGEQHFSRIQKVFRQLVCKRYHHFYWTLEVDRKKNISKNSCFQVTKFLAQFPRNIEFDKPHRTTYKGPQFVPTNTV